MEDGWMLDETACAGAEHLDPAVVAGYDRKQGNVPDEAAAVDVLALLAGGVGADATVVDLGAGTGRFSVVAAAHFHRIVAVDPSPPMLAVARERAAAQRRSNVEFVRAGFLTYEHAGAAADAVCTRNALHQLPDFWKVMALSRIAGLLRPGGVLRLRDLIFNCAPQEADAVIQRWLDGAAADPAQGYTRADLAEHIREEHSTFAWLLERMLDAVGFDVADVSFRGDVYGAYTCLRR